MNLGKTVCRHDVDTEGRCIECRIELAKIRLAQLSTDQSRAAEHERTMHENDIKLLYKMLVAGKVSF